MWICALFPPACLHQSSMEYLALQQSQRKPCTVNTPVFVLLLSFFIDPQVTFLTGGQMGVAPFKSISYCGHAREDIVGLFILLNQPTLSSSEALFQLFSSASRSYHSLSSYSAA